jgi:pimeloyl-ACP methyl ester carboxylesterase
MTQPRANDREGSRMLNAPPSRFQFPVGYHKFHKKRLFNFQLNRWYSLGYAGFEDCREAGRAVKTFADWKREMLRLAEKAVEEDKLLRAAFYYRAAEFYLLAEVPEKELLYDEFSRLFYRATQNDKIERLNVPYREGYLPAMKIPSAGENKGALVMQGGFDSFIEEFYSMMRYFSERGYEVIAFDGPGQGAARRKYGLALDLEWEKPVKAVLDFLNLDQVTLLGISLGGWLALRAAAFEPRITRVIATGHAVDYMKSMNSLFRAIHLWFFKHARGFMDRMAAKKFRGESIPAWMVKHLMYITKKQKPMDALETYLLMNDRNIHSELVKQDVLILSGRGDHFIPFKMHRKQLKALTNAKSVSGRIFTKKEHAQNHCQTGNMGLALNVMAEWIEEKSRGG